MTILRNSMLLRYTAAMALFSIAINTACANSGQVGIAPVSTTTLKESILFAIDRDPSISQQAAQLGIGQAQIDEARSGWMPQISLNGSTGHSQTTDSSGSLKNSAAWGLSLTQLLYDFGKTNNSISQSSAQRDSYRYQLMGTLSDVAEKTALSYVEVKRYSDLLQAAIDNVQALKNVEQLAKLRADAGVSSTSDELQTRTRIAGMQATVAQYHAALNSARQACGINRDAGRGLFAGARESCRGAGLAQPHRLFPDTGSDGRAKHGTLGSVWRGNGEVPALAYAKPEGGAHPL